MSKPRLLAFYLPQYHPTKENNIWWGEGFTEWTNVGKAKKIFPGHYQPKVPSTLGYYDLRISDVREKQALLAKEAGIEGFCYWHYWFNGKRLLDLPISKVLKEGKPDFPFCFCWANHSWYAKNWDKTQKNRLLIEQTYPGEEDYINHFFSLLPAFKDSRYIKVDGKPMFGIYSPRDIPDSSLMISLWNKLAKENGFPGVHFVCIAFKHEDINKWLTCGYNSIIFDPMFLKTQLSRYLYVLMHKIFKIPILFNYKDYIKLVLDKIPIDDNVYPCIIPNFDHTPRSGHNGNLFYNSSPNKWRNLLCNLFPMLENKNRENNVVFIKSWNEWGEGNYLEPDIKYGDSFLKAIKEALKEIK